MIRNREQLLQLSADWATIAKNDIRGKMIEFIETSGMNQAQLSDVLGMSMGEIEQILNGNGEITLTTFAKLLIATDHVLEIKPLAMSQMAQGMPRIGGRGTANQQPRDRNGRFVSRNNMPQEMVDGYPQPPRGARNGMPMFPTDEHGNLLPPTDENGNVLPPPPHFMGGMMPPRFGGMPGVMRNHQRRGGNMQPQMPQPRMVVQEENPQPTSELDALDRRSLVSLIRDNGWDGDIDLVNSTRSEMIDFINSRNVVPNTPQDEESERIGQMLAAELERNPHLRDVIAKYI